MVPPAHGEGKAINFVKTRRAWIDAETIEEQKKAVQQGYDYSILPSELRYSREETEDLLTQLQGQQQHLFMFSGLIYTWAESPEKLTEQVLQTSTSRPRRACRSRPSSTASVRV